MTCIDLAPLVETLLAMVGGVFLWTGGVLLWLLVARLRPAAKSPEKEAAGRTEKSESH
jgi:hypothetical protein